MKLIILFYCLFLQIVISSQKSSAPPRSIDPNYRPLPTGRMFTIVAPTAIRQGKPFDVNIRGFDITESVYLTIRINGTSDEGDRVKIKKYATISRSKTSRSVSFDTSDIASGTYTLVVEDDEGFTEQRSLTYITKKVSFFIQFNKAIFTPGDLLQFRVFAVDSETKAVTPTCANSITISDPNGNSIESFQNVKFKRGKFESSFQLSEKASLGIWKVSANCDQEIETKFFEVAEYILPLLDAKLTVPSVTPMTDGKIPITVDIMYTSGGEASGKATVTISKYGSNILTRTVNIVSGTATFDVDIKNDLKAEAGEYLYFQAELNFEDPLTGIKVSDSKTFYVRPYAYRFVAKEEGPFKPGNDLKFTITMIKIDGGPAPKGTKIYLKPNNPKTLLPQNLTIGEDGSVSSSYYIPEDTTYVSVEIIAENAMNGYFGPRLPAYGTGDYCRIELVTEKPKLNQPVQVKIRTRRRVDFVMVHIVSKALLLKSSKVYFDSDSNEDNDLNTVNYEFKTSFKNAPVTQVIAYYLNGYGDFIVGQIRISFNDELPNYLQISPATQDVKPGAEISLNIESKVGSRVSLVAMDQRLLLLRDGANITKSSVFDDLSQYTYSNVKFDYNNLAQYEYDFGRSGLFVFTNIPRPPRKYRRPISRVERASRPRKSGPSGRNDVAIRKDFRETFLWREVAIYESANDENDETKGLETITETVPESITTYLIYGVSMSKYDGMGLCDNVPSVSIFLPFFISVDFPFSIKRNEVLVQDIFIFNYLKKTQPVEIKITKDKIFEAVDIDRYEWKDINGFYVKNIIAKVGQNIKLQFALKSSSLGFTSFEITAKGPLAGDGVKKQLRIIPEGIPRSLTSSVFIALDSKNLEFITTLACTLPKSAYQDTTSISATVVGDIFGKALSNLDKLIKMPIGCGEQTMLSLAPDIAIYDYLSASQKLTPALKTTLETYIRAGVQNELRYQRRDGSFSAFGNNDPSGSTWLTAYVIEYFYFAKKMITIDSNIIKKGADFVVQQQKPDGSFNEPGRVIHSDMQGGSGAGIGLTAYCVIMLTFLLPDYPDYEAARNKAVKYLEDNYSSERTTYELGIIAYALKVADSSEATSAYNMFYAQKTETTTLLYWSTPAPQNDGYSYYNQPRSIDIEITSYGLITVIKRGGSLATVLKIVKYLVSQANNLGGYSSSQDTVMAFYALSQFARTYSVDANVELTMAPNIGDDFTASIDSSNAFTLQSFDLNPSTRKIIVSATTEDSGLAIVSLICNFYEDPTKVVPVFNVTYIFENTCTHRITMNACAAYIPNGKSNMAIMIITLPSGFIFNARQIQNNPDISRTEIINQGTKATFYFNSIANRESCAIVNAFRSKFVADLKGATIEVYDYYDTSKQGMTSYPAPDLSGECIYYR